MFLLNSVVKFDSSILMTARIGNFSRENTALPWLVMGILFNIWIITNPSNLLSSTRIVFLTALI